MAPALPYLLLIAAYLIGSIPFSYLVVKLAAGAWPCPGGKKASVDGDQDR